MTTTGSGSSADKMLWTLPAGYQYFLGTAVSSFFTVGTSGVLNIQYLGCVPADDCTGAVESGVRVLTVTGLGDTTWGNATILRSFGGGADMRLAVTAGMKFVVIPNIDGYEPSNLALWISQDESPKVTISRSNGTSTFTGIGTYANPFVRTARVRNDNADGMQNYTFTAIASGTAYVSAEISNGGTGAIRKNGAIQGFEFDDESGIQTRTFAVTAGNTITITSNTSNSEFGNVRVWVN